MENDHFCPHRFNVKLIFASNFTLKAVQVYMVIVHLDMCQTGDG